MASKKATGKKGGFSLTPISLSTPIKPTDGFTNLVETAKGENKETTKILKSEDDYEQKSKTDFEKENRQSEKSYSESSETASTIIVDTEKPENKQELKEKKTEYFRLSENELLKLLDADNLDDIYEISDVLRASSLKLYATLSQMADERGRIRVKNHELMSKAGIKGIATLYKQERWLMDLKLLEKKAKPGPHDGSSYVVYRLETLPLPKEIFEKFDEYLVSLKR